MVCIYPSNTLLECQGISVSQTIELLFLFTWHLWICLFNVLY